MVDIGNCVALLNDTHNNGCYAFSMLGFKPLNWPKALITCLRSSLISCWTRKYYLAPALPLTCNRTISTAPHRWHIHSAHYDINRIYLIYVITVHWQSPLENLTPNRPCLTCNVSCAHGTRLGDITSATPMHEPGRQLRPCENASFHVKCHVGDITRSKENPNGR